MDFTTLGAGLAAFVGFLGFSVLIELGTLDFQPINPPPFMEERGYTGEIITNRILDSLREFHEVAITDEQLKQTAGEGIAAVAKLSNQYGVRDIVLATQWLLGLAPPSYQVEIVENGESAEILVRGPDQHGRLTVRRDSRPVADPEQVIRATAFQVLELTSPYTAMLYVYVRDIERGDFTATRHRVEANIRGCLENVNPRYACSDDAFYEFYLTEALALLYSDEAEAALESIAKAISLSPGKADALAFRGDILAKLGRGQAAAESYAAAVARASGVAVEFRRWGAGYARQGNFVFADKRFRTAHALGLDDPGFFADWGLVLISGGRPDEAIPLLERAHAALPANQQIKASLERARGLAAAAPSAGSMDAASPDAASPDAAAR